MQVIYYFISIYPGFQYRLYFSYLLYCTVNLAHTISQNLQGTANMSGAPFPQTQWIAQKVVDGNTDQTATRGSCAIMDFSENYTSVWLSVQLKSLFNVAYIEIFFRNELSMLLYECINQIY